MNTSSDDAMSISLRRADFLAALWAALGVFWFVSALGDGIPDELLSFDVFFIANGFFWLGGAAFYHRHPDSVRRGREPAPRSWFGLVGAVIGAFALMFVLVVML